MQTITHQQAFDLLKKYNKDSFHPACPDRGSCNEMVLR